MLGGGSFEVEGNPFDIKQERKAARRSCEIEVEGWAGRVHYQGVVINLSASGLCIKLNEPIKVKSKGTVSVTIMDDTLSAERTVDCLTRWCRVRQSDEQQYLGLEYKDMKSMGKSWVKGKMQDLAFRPYNLKEQRKELRADCFLKGTVSIGGDSVPCFIKNIASSISVS